MATRMLTADIIAKAAVAVLDNNLVMAKKVYRGYEQDYGISPNGYEVGDIIGIRRPVDYTVRSGATSSPDDPVEGKITMGPANMIGVDLKFTSQDLTTDIRSVNERVLKPAMVQLANKIDLDLMGLFDWVPNWVGTAGQAINSYGDFAEGAQRLDEFAAPQDMRCAILSPNDHWELLGSQTGLFITQAASGAYRQGTLGRIGGIETFMSQNVPTFTPSTEGGQSLTITSDLSVNTWDDFKDARTQSITVNNGAGSAVTLKKGDVIEIDNCFAVNPVTKQTLGFQKQFTVRADATISASSSAAVSIHPWMIGPGASGIRAHQNVSFADFASTTGNISIVNDNGGGARQNLMFHPNAFALAVLPLARPPGAVDVGSASYKGLNVRVIPYYDGTNDVSNWRLDVLYAVAPVDTERQAVRLSGAS